MDFGLSFKKRRETVPFRGGARLLGNCTVVPSGNAPLDSHLTRLCACSAFCGDSAPQHLLAGPKGADRAQDRAQHRAQVQAHVRVRSRLRSRLMSGSVPGSGQGSGQGVVLAKGCSGCTSPWTLLPILPGPLLHWEPVILPCLGPLSDSLQGNESG